MYPFQAFSEITCVYFLNLLPIGLVTKMKKKKSGTVFTQRVSSQKALAQHLLPKKLICL